MIGRVACCILLALLSGCAAPPLKLYTLASPSLSGHESGLSAQPVLIEVARVTMPDYLDNEDLLIRRGTEVVRSPSGRWASRLSLATTDLLTAILAKERPDALVTDEPQSLTPDYRISIDISRLDVTADGTATVEADWQCLPGDAAKPVLRNRGRFTATGPVDTDAAIVALYEQALEQLGGAIPISTL